MPTRTNKAALSSPLSLVASLLLLLVVTWGCAPETEQDGALEENGPTATAELRDAENRTVGEATLTETEGEGVEVQVQLRGLDADEGQHGIHIHETGSCSPDFQTAGGHFNPTGASHGLDNPDGPHAGDLPNIEIGSEGDATYETTTDRITLDEGERSVLAGDGTAFIVHAGEDDQETDPSGDAGDRLACGVITSAAGGGG